MKKNILILMLIMLCVAIPMQSQAKWWIFGQGSEGINVNYIHINRNSFDEGGQSLTLYSENLQDGIIRINGRATVRNGRIGSAAVSLDGKQTWQNASLSNNGYFEYTFTPELGKEYEVYVRLIDTFGRTNEIDATYKRVKVVEERVRDRIMEALSGAIAAYEEQNPNSFMQFVSQNFTGDYTNLDFAIRRDFNAFDYIKLTYFINNISQDNLGRFYVSIQYIRQAVATRSGQAFSDNGYTEFVFRNDGGNFKIFSMKNPLIFGLSDAGNVATGTIQSTSNDPILLVDARGDVDMKPFRDGIRMIEDNTMYFDDFEDESASKLVTGSASLAPTDGIDFATGTSGTDAFYTPHGGLHVNARSFIAASCSLDSIKTAPSGGYVGANIDPNTTGCFAIRTINNKYAIIKITNHLTVGMTGICEFEYKYQPDGSRNF